MKLLYTIPFLFSLNAMAETSSINQNVNWSDVSSTPSVNSQVIVQDFIPVADNKKDSFIQDELTNFDFLEKSLDERVFYTLKANVRSLNKYTDKITDYEITDTKPLDLGKFKIEVKSCANIEINHVENQLAFLQILKNDKLVFKGWMSNINKTFNFPELTEMYINLISCEKVNPTVTPAKEVKEEEK